MRTLLLTLLLLCCPLALADKPAKLTPDSTAAEAVLTDSEIKPEIRLAIQAVLLKIGGVDLPAEVALSPDAVQSIAAAGLKLDDFESAVQITGYAPPVGNESTHDVTGLFAFRDWLDRRQAVAFSIGFAVEDKRVLVHSADLARLLPPSPRVVMLMVPAADVPADRSTISANYGALLGFALAHAEPPGAATKAKGDMFLFAFSRDWLGADAMLTLQAATLAEAPGTALANTKSFDFDGWPAVVAPLNIAPESPLLLGRVVWQQGSKDQGLVVAEGQITPGGAHSEVEPNDSRETANPWPLGESMAGRITPVGDHDWYMIDVPQAGRLSVDLPPGSSKFGWPVSHVLTLEGARPDYADGDGSNHVELDVGKPGPVALLINANYDNEAADRLYRLTSKLDPAADADEAKDEAGRPLALGAAGTGAIFPAGDVDRFELKIDKPGQLVAVISAWPEQFGLEPNLTIVDLRKDIRAGSLELPIRIPMGEISNAGPIMVEFRDSYDDAANTAGYQIRFEVE